MAIKQIQKSNTLILKSQSLIEFFDDSKVLKSNVPNRLTVMKSEVSINTDKIEVY